MSSNARQKMEHTFSVDYYSEQDDYTYRGTFITKKLSVLDQARVNVRKSELNGGKYYDDENPGVGIDEITDNMNYMIAFLETSLTKTPEWWDINSIGDVVILGKVFKEAIEHQSRFRGRKEAPTGANHDGSGEGNRQGTPQEAHGPGVVREVVGQEVQAALEP